MSFTEFALTTTLGSLTFSTPFGWVALGIAGVAGLVTTIAVIAHEDGKTERARIKRDLRVDKRR